MSGPQRLSPADQQKAAWLTRVLSRAFYVGLVLLAAPVVRNEWFLWTAQRAEGTIEGYATQRSGGGGRRGSGGVSYCAKVSFVDVVGAVRSVRDSVCTSTKKEIGSKVTVLYKGLEGGPVEVDGFFIRWRPWLVAVVGGLPAVIMLYMIGWVIGSVLLFGRIVSGDDLGKRA